MTCGPLSCFVITTPPSPASRRRHALLPGRPRRVRLRSRPAVLATSSSVPTSASCSAILALLLLLRHPRSPAPPPPPSLPCSSTAAVATGPGEPHVGGTATQRGRRAAGGKRAWSGGSSGADWSRRAASACGMSTGHGRAAAGSAAPCCRRPASPPPATAVATGTALLLPRACVAAPCCRRLPQPPPPLSGRRSLRRLLCQATGPPPVSTAVAAIASSRHRGAARSHLLFLPVVLQSTARLAPPGGSLGAGTPGHAPIRRVAPAPTRRTAPIEEGRRRRLGPAAPRADRARDAASSQEREGWLWRSRRGAPQRAHGRSSAHGGPSLGGDGRAGEGPVESSRPSAQAWRPELGQESMAAAARRRGRGGDDEAGEGSTCH